MAKIKNDRPLTLARLKEVLDYDLNSGVFIWRTFLGPRALNGSVAGIVRSHGYRLIGIDGSYYRASRLAWFYVHGEWPARYLDHINGVKSDDRLSNLREATVSDNACNIAARSKTGVKGVYEFCGKYQASIMRHGIQISLGTYKNLKDATEARKAAALMLHSEFASENRS